MSGFSAPDQALCRRLAAVRLLALDVDGVLTDGRLFFTAQGDEAKAFNIQDGLGIKLLRRAGVEVALITGRTSPLTARRAADLQLTYLVQGREDKKEALAELLQTLGLQFSEVAYVGDDLPDLGAIESVGVGITVANAHWAVRERAHHVTRHAGGDGAVREVCDLILHARGQLDAVIGAYRGEPS